MSSHLHSVNVTPPDSHNFLSCKYNRTCQDTPHHSPTHHITEQPQFSPTPPSHHGPILMNGYDVSTGEPRPELAVPAQQPRLTVVPQRLSIRNMETEPSSRCFHLFCHGHLLSPLPNRRKKLSTTVPTVSSSQEPFMLTPP